MSEDTEQLTQYVQEHSEAAFGQLVGRHINMVYSAVLRLVGGDAALAQDVTQTVFIDLARKAPSLTGQAVLAGWLHRHACFTASKAVRAERRRRVREQTAVEMQTLENTPGPNWERIAPHLDESLNALSSADREALVLRFLWRQDLHAVGASLGIGEDAAQKRVSRALEKLRDLLRKRGLAALTTTALASMLTAESVSAAPAGLAVSITTAATALSASGGAGVGLTLTKLLTMTKIQAGVAGVLVVAGVGASWGWAHQQLEPVRQESRRLLQENQALEQQMTALASLEAENRRLSNRLTWAKENQGLASQQAKELLSLRKEKLRLQAKGHSQTNSAQSLAALLNDPRMKDFYKANCQAMVEKNYGTLFKELNLSEETLKAFKETLINQQVADTETGMALLTGGAGALTNQVAQAAEQKRAAEEQLHQLLGEESFEKYKTYEKSAAQRGVVAGFKDQMTTQNLPLNTEQESRLLKALAEASSGFRYTVDLSDQIQLAQAVREGKGVESLQSFETEQDRLNALYLQRAQSILSEPQLQAFEAFLKLTLQRQKSSVALCMWMFPSAAAQ